MDITELRKYRFQFESPVINNESKGIALFDLIGTFLVAYLLDKYYLKLSKNKLYAYYLSVIPFGILVHHVIAHIRANNFFNPIEFTFLNKKIFNGELNIYKILLIVLVYFIVVNLK